MMTRRELLLGGAARAVILSPRREIDAELIAT
jgi:hypothetical protein